MKGKELIAEARECGPVRNADEYLIERLADALEAATRERDAALARIAELEAEIKTRTEGFEEVMAGREASPEEWRLIGRLEIAEARIAEAAKLHRRDSPGLGGEWCQSDGLKWPCPTAVSLGLNKGENDES